jgi:hypothetical protein
MLDNLEQIEMVLEYHKKELSEMKFKIDMFDKTYSWLILDLRKMKDSLRSKENDHRTENDTL